MENEVPMDESNEMNGNVGAVNAPSQNYNGKPYQMLCSDDLVGNWFATLEEANNFYYAYAMWKRAVDEPSGRKRIRTPRKETRTDCRARLKVLYCTKKKQYVVRNFDTEHNHSLVPPSESHFLRSQRKCGAVDVAQVTVMQNVSIRTCHAYEYIVDRAGGYVNVGFMIKDLYNKLDDET
ncbi:hypothetical protein M0R45_018612 [Rubus argutus]|uniref:FAR1 domain-containing protein n=1 Tax=Rubus argutus TaxID=59490 RepID=A0AAW1X341_RUBAR